MKNKPSKALLSLVGIVLAGLLGLSAAQSTDLIQGFEQLFSPQPQVTQLEEIPAYDGAHQEIQINHGRPVFSESELTLERDSWETYSNLDRYNRVGSANAMLSRELFPTNERETLYIDPTGWRQKRIEGNQWLYNRSHLIGFQLTGQNNNGKNLMTGTRSLNMPHMSTHENNIAAYIRTTGHHVRYRVTPFFKGEELVARGVQLEAASIEDDRIQLNVFIYNVQEGYTINYQTGTSRKNS